MNDPQSCQTIIATAAGSVAGSAAADAGTAASTDVIFDEALESSLCPKKEVGHVPLERGRTSERHSRRGEKDRVDRWLQRSPD